MQGGTILLPKELWGVPRSQQGRYDQAEGVGRGEAMAHLVILLALRSPVNCKHVGRLSPHLGELIDLRGLCGKEALMMHGLQGRREAVSFGFKPERHVSPTALLPLHPVPGCLRERAS